MKKNLLSKLLLCICVALSFGACEKNEPEPNVNAADIDYTSKNANSWHNYSKNVSALLKNDATVLYNSWSEMYNNEPFATTFKNHKSVYTSALSCIEQILEGCQDIANEVGTAKIGEPYDLYLSGKTTEALYAVESWYSWHSRDDYTNNIYSIRNSYYGSCDGSVSENSLAKLISTENAEMDNQVVEAINAAVTAIQAIPQPFRNNIASSESKSAMDACAKLVTILEELEAYIQNNSNINIDAVLDPIVINYVDVVVLPTYAELKDAANTLNNAIVSLATTPSNDNFKKACEAWLAARKPWETSEAFLFGPVDDLGLDPNMDSWPLDQDAIVNILESGKFSELEWVDGDSDDVIEAAQSVRGFHTLEFLLFKDGKPRTIE